MASGSISGYYRSYQLRSDWSSSINVAGNYSDVTVNHYLVLPSGWSLYIGSRTNSCTCNETKSFTSPSISSGGGQTIHLGTTTHRVYHNTDGTKSINLSTTFNMKATISGTYVASITNSGTITLDTIPRYFSNTPSVTLSAVDETHVKCTWSTSETCNWIRYRMKLNGTEYAGWVDIGNPNAKSGSFIFSTANKTNTQSSSANYNLEANTTYQFNMWFRRADSGLATEAGWKSVTTYNNPYISALSDFNIGTSFSCVLNNPLGRNLTLSLYKKGGSSPILQRSTSTNGTYTFVTIEEENNSLYNSIPSSTNGDFTILVACSDIGSSIWSDSTVGYKKYYTVEANCKPTLSITARDTNNFSLNLTGDSSKVIKYISNVTVNLTATGNKGASISSQGASCNDGKSGTGSQVVFNAVENNKFTGVATDSRGYSVSADKTLTFINYILLTLNVNVYRPSPTTGNIAVEFKGNFFNGNFGTRDNSLSLKYRYKESGSGIWGNWIALNPIKSGNTFSNGSSAISLGSNFDYSKDYDFEFIVEDEVFNENSSYGPQSASETVYHGSPIADWGADDFNINGKLNLFETSIMRHIANVLYPVNSLYVSISQSIPEWLAGEWVFLNTITSNGTTYYVYKRTNENERIYYNDVPLLYGGEEIYVENTLMKGSDI